jgi:RNA recognition motif-containing protein
VNAKILLVENLDRATTAAHLENLFSICGDVRSVKVWPGRGNGIIEMTSAGEARRACESLDGSVLWGRSMKVRPAHGAIRQRMAFLIGRFI